MIKNKYHKLHNHPITEQRENIDRNKVLVDIEFEHLFSESCIYWDEKHVLVLRAKYDEFKNQSKQYNKMIKTTEFKETPFKESNELIDKFVVENNFDPMHLQFYMEEKYGIVFPDDGYNPSEVCDYNGEG